MLSHHMHLLKSAYEQPPPACIRSAASLNEPVTLFGLLHAACDLKRGPAFLLAVSHSPLMSFKAMALPRDSSSRLLGEFHASGITAHIPILGGEGTHESIHELAALRMLLLNAVGSASQLEMYGMTVRHSGRCLCYGYDSSHMYTTYRHELTNRGSLKVATHCSHGLHVDTHQQMTR
jgi:hypothetical protein